MNQTFHFNYEVPYIDVNPDLVPYTFSIKLEDRTYQFTIRYNETGGFYTVDLSHAYDGLLCCGDPVRYGRPLFGTVEDERFPLPVIIPQCFTGDKIDTVTRENFGREVKLYLHERRVQQNDLLETRREPANRGFPVFIGYVKFQL